MYATSENSNIINLSGSNFRELQVGELRFNTVQEHASSDMSEEFRFLNAQRHVFHWFELNWTVSFSHSKKQVG